MADNSAGNWCLIESDPGVFTELIREFGMQIVNNENKLQQILNEVMYFV